MTTLYRSGFETGNISEWAGTKVSNGLQPSVTTFSFRGSYAGLFLTNPTLDTARSQVYISSDMSDIYVRGYFYVNQGITALQRHDRFYLLRLLGPDNQIVAVVGIRRDGDLAPRWALSYRLTTTPFANATTFGGPVSEADQGRWICVEIHYNRETGLYEVWIDGRLEITMAVTPGDLTAITEVQAGIYKTGVAGQAWDPTGQYTIEVYGDEIIIADRPIGPEVSECTVDADCPSEKPYCVGGVCVQCRTNNDCPTGMICQNGICVTPSPCFIATAAYGTSLAQEISVLRQFRDNFMDVTGVGRKLAETYYRTSPPIARAIAQHNTLRAFVRAILKPIVQLLQK